MSSFAARSPALAGQLVLLAEDEASAPHTESLLRSLGASVLLAHDAYRATLVASRHALTAAILDVRLGRHTIAGVSACLDLYAVPFLLVVGAEEPADAHWEPAVLRRPLDAHAVVGSFAAIRGQGRDLRRKPAPRNRRYRSL
jgi:CheY-like chemotaxis protein